MASTPDRTAVPLYEVPEESPVRSRDDPYVLLSARNERRRRRRAAARRIVYSSEEEVEVPQEVSKKNAKWRDRKGATFKYVEDNLQVDRVCMETAMEGFDNGVKYREKHGIRCQNTFRRIIRRATARGMKVNASKTAMVCVSDAQSYQARSYIEDSEGAGYPLPRP